MDMFGYLKKVVVWGIFLFLFGIAGYGIGFASSSPKVKKTSSPAVPSYSTMMEKLDGIQKMILEKISIQKEKVFDESKQLGAFLNENYGYKALECLGILDFDYGNNLDEKVKQELFDDLLKFNNEIYKYRIGLTKDSDKIVSDLSGFVAQTLKNKVDNIMNDYENYTDKFLNKVKKYITNNKNLILPLAKKMQSIDTMKKEKASFEKMALQANEKVLSDDLFSRLSLFQKEFRKILGKNFDLIVAKKVNDNNLKKILALKQEYLANFDKDFDKEIYTMLLNNDFYRFDAKEFDTFFETYYSGGVYQCANLVAHSKDFDHDYTALTQKLAKENDQITKFARSVFRYKQLDTQKQNALKMKVFHALRNIITDYKGVKIRVVLLKIGR